MTIGRSELAGMFDHTQLQAYATRDDFQRLCDEAMEYGFKSVAINSYPVRMCREMLEGSDVLVGAAISFPLGQMAVRTKVAEARNAIEDGAQEFDYVQNVGRAKEHDWSYLEYEMGQMVSVARDAGVCCKVIIETCYLTDEEIARTCDIARDVRPDFVKTSTGFGTGGATVEHIRLMKEHVGPDVQVKAAGGIRSLDTALAMVDAGATRLGARMSVKIMQEYDERFGTAG